ncbi:hypothetical protein V0R50_25925 [Pseudomonas sp. 148P]|uniref:ATP-binding protein n=1 Tax=Pseudomonas ulcerans TaxID=3115852 RepID=A0ABU7HYL5_9PSED|nr:MULTISPECIES: hypothetical protein [unclassified Pseudomonas]MEE1925711.1 hypothetical protein [Pseudomonas sp. 147P]MEE1936675.1 hypothetical protein [Pseudomonas sp. 148P]
MHLFPEQFAPQAWSGARSKQFILASDAFQQLLGDALHGHFLADAHVASTAGRDGSIDAWVTEAARADGQFNGFCFPLLVECKHHDDDLPQTSANIARGWAAVKKKLLKQAGDGWPGLYEPWRQARAYLYCISARFPNQQARNDLQKEIRDFFAGLPAAQRPPLDPQQIRVWDWSDLRAWLNTQVLLCDHWRGVQPAQWIDHLGLCKQLRDAPRRGQLSFQTYLLEENLSFITPPDDDPAHPKVLLDALARGENLLLEGEGGIGKTRTLHEVAELALKRRWRVLHLRPSEQEVDLAEAAPMLLSSSNDTLVLIDYIDQLANFDALYWRNTLLPEALERGVRLHLLTNARPSGSSESLERLKSSELFRSVLMRPDAEQRKRVTASIEARLCPTAIAQIGQEAVQRHCGPRPIIAMFIAQALERLAVAGELRAQLDNIPQPDDLLGWLRRRQSEAGMFPQWQAASRWEMPAAPSRQLIAVAAALAVCPFPADELPQVIECTLQGEQAQVAWILQTLENDGWIEVDGDSYRTPHDAIADEILRQMLKHPDRVMADLLVSAGQGRPLGRFARSLGRLSGEGVLPKADKASIETSTRAWLQTQAATLGQALSKENPGVVAYALGSLLDYRPWRETAESVWAELVAPWLERNGSLLEARHFIHRGLKSLPGDSLLQPALDWLADNGNRVVASFILGPLLDKRANLGAQRESVVDSTMHWLARHGADRSAGFVLSPLLGWSEELLEGREGAVIGAALRWLGQHGTDRQAQFVFASLLEWDERRLGGDQPRVLALALSWLEQSQQQEQNRVLPPLLAWAPERLGEQGDKVLASAVAWLERFAESYAVGRFMLPPLLRWGMKRLGDHRNRVLDAALHWTALHAVETGVHWVLSALLEWERWQLGEHAPVVVSQSLAWLAQRDNQASQEIGYVLHLLLKWQPVEFAAAEQDVLAAALRWLAFADNAVQVQAGYVLPPLLRWRKLPLDQRSRIVRLAIVWLDLYAEREDASYVLEGMLEASSASSDAEYAADVIARAEQWLKARSEDPERSFIIARLLKVTTVPLTRWLALAEEGLSLLEQGPGNSSDSYVLQGVLCRLPMLPATLHERWTLLVVRWVGCARKSRHVGRFFYACRVQLNEADLAPLRPLLDAAVSAREDLETYDWLRPMKSRESSGA